VPLAALGASGAGCHSRAQRVGRQGLYRQAVAAQRGATRGAVIPRPASLKPRVKRMFIPASKTFKYTGKFK